MVTGFLRDFGGKRSAGLIGPSRDPELAAMDAALAVPVEADTAEADRLIAELKAALMRNEPLPGDRVAWHDGTYGVVAIIAAPWLDPGEALVYRHEEAAHAGAPSWCVEADSLTAAEVLADGRVEFTYRGSLR